MTERMIELIAGGALVAVGSLLTLVVLAVAEARRRRQVIDRRIG